MSRNEPRRFGLLVGAVLSVTAFSPLRHGGPVQIPLAVLALISLVLAVTRPRLFSQPHRLWMEFAKRLHAVVSPVVLAVVYFALITPAAFLFRLFRRDSLRLQLEPHADTYWLERTTQPGPMTDQF